MCHTDDEMTIERDGREVSLAVNEAAFDASEHGKLLCVDCHEGFDAEELPHRAGDDIYEVDCLECHEEDAYDASVHGKRGVECYECHTKHEVKRASEFEKTMHVSCLVCHRSGGVPLYKSSAHFRSYQRIGEPSCIDCHNESGHDIQATSFSVKAENALCRTCHTPGKTEFSRTLHASVAVAGNTSCVSCHGAHETSVAKFTGSSKACLECHLDAELMQSFDRPELVEFVKTYETSVHAVAGHEGSEGAECVDCHGDHVENGLEATRARFERGNVGETCGACHEEVVEDYLASTHGELLAEGDDLAPTCVDCHGEHDISAVGAKEYNKVHRKDVCYDCHVENAAVVARVRNESILRYDESAHYSALRNGNENAAVCSDCHGAHLVLRASDERSTVHPTNVAKTCGVIGCHKEASEDFLESVHADALFEGVADAPTCVDCHGDHVVAQGGVAPEEGETINQYISNVCADCHASVELAERYDVSVLQAETYYDSYHGLAVRGGSKTAANCASCHEHHEVKTAADSTSSIHPSNLSETCGSCHPGANLEDDFKKVHLTYSEDESILLFYLERFYWIIIVGTIGGMVIHNLFDVYRKTVDRKKYRDEMARLRKEGKYYLRMTVNERIQHFILLTTFLGLVISGFGLVYPDAFWVEWIRYVMGERAFELRGITHRVLGFMMIAASFYHVYYLAFTDRGRKMLIDLLPTPKDFKDAITNIKYITGLGKEHPHFGRFTYMEKAEYWALIWGTAVMSVTGVMLTFNDFFLANFPKLYLDAATVVHFYEAWLAWLAIVVWHWYYVIFNPIVYPLNTAFIYGTVDEFIMKQEHPEELEKIEKAKKRGETDENA
jgi:cytochrome b subunit of formate dehydrogenase/ssDNA-binding Zn-finger/Zn-ribbon topoisomerase 1